MTVPLSTCINYVYFIILTIFSSDSAEFIVDFTVPTLFKKGAQKIFSFSL